MTTYTATYSPDDNKLRLYTSTRLDAETYARVKAAGFKWAPKQDLFVAPMWTPHREDLLIELAGDIDDEDRTLAERAEDRAERFGEYSDNRQADAVRARDAVAAIADNIPFGQPILVGHHSERHARRDAEKIQNGMRRAVKMWETSKYWESRAAGAIHHAKYKERPDVRARRIRTIEADKRKSEKTMAEQEKRLAAWLKVRDMTDADQQRKAALFLANYACGLSFCFTLDKYPRAEGVSTYEGPQSVWGALDGGIITPLQAAELCIPCYAKAAPHRARWIAHYDNRLAYERAMMAASGGTAADKTGPEVGGAVRCWASPGYGKGWAYIHKVNKISVTVLDNWGNGGPNFRRLVEFDKLKAIMSKAEVEAARDAGQIAECKDGIGFYLGIPAETRDEAKDRTHAEHVAEFGGGAPSDFDAMRESLKAGVQVIAAPQLFPTPADICARMVEYAKAADGDRILEPSAGTGNILDALHDTGRDLVVSAVEINSQLCDRLRARFAEVAPYQVSIHCADFLDCKSGGDLGAFDCVLMNPPFQNGADIKHILHARSFLKPGGVLVAICADGPRQRKQLQELCDVWEELGPDAFKDQGTSVRSALVVMRIR